MVIRFECNHCNKKLAIADTEAGKWVKCPGCGEKVRIPSQAAGGATTAKKPVPAAKPLPKPPPAKRRPAEEDLVEVDPIDEAPPPRAAKTRAPARRDEEEEDEEPRRPSRRARGRRDEDEDEDEDEEPRRRSRRARARRDEDEDEEDEDWDEDDEEKGPFSPNRIRGVVSIVVGFGVLAFGLFFGRLQESDVEILKWGVVALGVLMFPVGIFYLIKG
ncbi:MAG: hypothetical protein HYS12_04140 [Planctomycetes bacterium]|nr:hypothetical protein [Planctomycetota bacterium]